MLRLDLLALVVLVVWIPGCTGESSSRHADAAMQVNRQDGGMEAALASSTAGDTAVRPSRGGAGSPGPRGFARSGAMTVARAGHTATRLPDGRVLAVGGYGVWGPIGACSAARNSAELYDPTTETWSGTGSMAVARWGHTATLLADGRVLVVGGRNESGSLASAELYNPAAGQWTTTGLLGVVRFEHTATLLPDGRVLVAGGEVASGEATASAELFDPATATWRPTGSLICRRKVHSAVDLPSGEVLIAGGTWESQPAPCNPWEIVERFDPATEQWTVQSPAPLVLRYAAVLHRLPDGTVLIVGDESRYSQPTAERFDPVANRWVSLSSPLVRGVNWQFQSTLLADGRVLFAGSADDHFSGGGGALAQLFDPVLDAWTLIGSLAEGRFHQSTTLLADGRALATGGVQYSEHNALASTEVTDATARTWTRTPDLGSARVAYAMSLLLDGRVLVTGGTPRNGLGLVYRSAEIFDPSTRTWAPIADMFDLRRDHTSTVLPDGRVLVVGGVYPPTAELFNPSSGTWVRVPSPVNTWIEHTATLLPPDGTEGSRSRVLVVGGSSSRVAELFDPAAGTWTSIAGPAIYRRGKHTATLLPGGRVLLAGGLAGDEGTASAELFDPATLTWQPTGSMVEARARHTATRLLDGRVLVVGGGSDGRSAELYDPAIGTWRRVGDLVHRRQDHAAALLRDGKVLVAGGLDTGAAEIFDPTTESWQPTIHLLVPRSYASATTLPDGNILLASGNDYAGNQASELFVHPSILPLPQLEVPEEGIVAVLVAAEDHAFHSVVTLAVEDAPVHGTLLGTPPELVYQPRQDYAGPDSFTVRATCSAGSSTIAKVDIDVLPVNDPPRVFAAFVYVMEDQPRKIEPTGSDVDGDTLVFRAISLPAYGSLEAVEGGWNYTPIADYAGPDSFDFVANDGTIDSAPATISILVQPVNDPPRFVPPTPEGTLAAREGELLSFTVAAIDVDDETIGLSVEPLPPGATFDAAEGLFAWTPVWTDAGTRTLVLKARDSFLTTERQLQVTVEALDQDDDGLPDGLELSIGLDPRAADSDGDTISDRDEVGSDPERPTDTDRDGTIDALDLDSDDDGISDAEEAGDDDLATPPVDTDNDGIPDYRDLDSDNDGIPDGSDLCRLVADPEQRDTDGDGMGDACDGDADGDGIPDDADNCPALANSDQHDADNDGIGDACDGDADGDGIPDESDNCPGLPNPDQHDADGDGVGDACDDPPPEPKPTADGSGCGCTNASGADASAFLGLLVVLAGARRRRGRAMGLGRTGSNRSAPAGLTRPLSDNHAAPTRLRVVCQGRS